MRLPGHTPLRGLLRCLDAAFFIPSFEDEGYRTLGDLRAECEDEVREFVVALAMPRGADQRLLAYAFREEDCAESEESRSAGPCPRDAAMACAGQALSKAWLTAVSPLYSRHMGCENMGPLLYSLVRFLKPTQCLEIGAGYTSAFLLQALEDNAQEAEAWRSWAGEVSEEEATWVLPEALPALGQGRLHCVDNLAHSGTTTPHLLRVAKDLGISLRLALHLDDAQAFLDESMESVPTFDFIWLDGLLDFAAPQRGSKISDGINAFLSRIWTRVAPGGYVLLHSTLTNTATREWLQGVQHASWGPPGSILSLLEPHKRFQNSTTLLQKRPPGYSEPIYSKLP